jgi:hypothetical protein
LGDENVAINVIPENDISEFLNTLKTRIAAEETYGAHPNFNSQLAHYLIAENKSSEDAFSIYMKTKGTYVDDIILQGFAYSYNYHVILYVVQETGIQKSTFSPITISDRVLNVLLFNNHYEIL